MTLKATIEGGGVDEYTALVAAWSCPEYDPDVSDVYAFAPTLALPDGVSLATSLTPPMVEVVVTLGLMVVPLDAD